jgi:hypothetical protein
MPLDAQLLKIIFYVDVHRDNYFLEQEYARIFSQVPQEEKPVFNDFKNLYAQNILASKASGGIYFQKIEALEKTILHMEVLYKDRKINNNVSGE